MPIPEQLTIDPGDFISLTDHSSTQEAEETKSEDFEDNGTFFFFLVTMYSSVHPAE